MATNALARFALVCCLALLQGCTYGFLYTNIHEPLTINHENTPAKGSQASASNKQVRIPVGRVSIGAQWNTAAIGEAAKKANLKRLYYADIQRISVLGGLWQDNTITVVGEE